MKLSSQFRVSSKRLEAKSGALAALLGLTPRAVQKQVKAGVLAKPAPQGWHDVTAAVRAYLEYVGDGRTDGEGLTAARERLARAQAVKVEQENHLRNARVIRADDIAEVLHSMAADLAARLDGLPGRVASELAGMTSAAEIRALLLRETRGIRQGHSDFIGKLANTPPAAAS